ncbi:MAG: C40 family peptidase, partial [Myxococcota bacterium]
RKRAEAVYRLLVKSGVPENRMTTEGLGSDNPRASNATLKGRRQNRRVEYALRRLKPPPEKRVLAKPTSPDGFWARRRADPSAHRRTSERIRQFAARWLSLPYKFGAKDPLSGSIDAAGFTRYLHRLVFGIDIPTVCALQASSGKPVDQDSAEPGDVLLFSLLPGRKVTHVGIYVDNGIMVHVSLARGIAYEKFEDTKWQTRYRGARRYLE